MPAIDPIAQARAEGFRDGLERAARKCREHQEVANGRAAAAAKAGQSHVWSRYASALEEAELLEAAIRALAPAQPPGVDLPDSTSAKATDPRGSGETGGEASIVAAAIELRRLHRDWDEYPEPDRDEKGNIKPGRHYIWEAGQKELTRQMVAATKVLDAAVDAFASPAERSGGEETR